jgi:hypothetical protein
MANAQLEAARMPLFTVIVPLIAAAIQAADTPITVIGHGWAPFISPMGEPFRARTPDDEPIARWFHQADRNRDGTLTADEMRADAERFFATLDSDRDGKIDAEERIAYESQIAPDIQVASRWRRSRQETAAGARPRATGEWDRRGRRRSDNGVDGYQVDGLQGAARYGLLNLPQPVIGADANLDRAVTLQEFRAAALFRFELLDSKREGRLELQQLKTLLPSRPKEGRRLKRRKNDVDTRIGVPFPDGG